MNLIAEQPIMHLETTLGHMRRGDTAGEGLLTLLYDTQIESGLSQPFYTYDPADYRYVTNNTR